MTFQEPNDRQETNRSKRLNEPLNEDELRQVEIGSLAILRAREMVAAQQEQERLDAERSAREADQRRYDEVGVYHFGPSRLMLVTGYTKLLLWALLVGVAFYLVRLATDVMANTKPALREGYNVQFFWGIVIMVIFFGFLALRVYRLWKEENLYADLYKVHRRRRPVWWLGIKKVNFEVPTYKARCSPQPSNFEVFLSKFKVDSSKVDIDTDVQKDQELHNLRNIRQAEFLRSIIDAASIRRK